MWAIEVLRLRSRRSVRELDVHVVLSVDRYDATVALAGRVVNVAMRTRTAGSRIWAMRLVTESNDSDAISRNASCEKVGGEVGGDIKVGDGVWSENDSHKSVEIWETCGITSTGMGKS